MAKNVRYISSNGWDIYHINVQYNIELIILTLMEQLTNISVLPEFYNIIYSRTTTIRIYITKYMQIV